MKTNTQSFAVGLRGVGLLPCVGSTAIATPVSRSRSPKSQPRDNETPTRSSAFRVGGNVQTALTSSDGVRWNKLRTRDEANFGGLIWANGIFVAAGYAGTMITSRNEVRWHRRRQTGTTDRRQSGACGNHTFEAVGWNGVVLTSKPGHAWTRSHSGIASQLGNVAPTDVEPAPQLFSCFTRINLLATGHPRVIGEINP